MEGGRRRQEAAGGGRRKSTDVKSNNPHLAGGEQVKHFGNIWKTIEFFKFWFGFAVKFPTQYATKQCA